MSTNYKEPGTDELEFVYALIVNGYTPEQICRLYKNNKYPNRNRRFVANRIRELQAICRVLGPQ